MQNSHVITATVNIFLEEEITDRDRALAVKMINSRVALGIENVVVRDSADSVDHCAFSLQIALANVQRVPEEMTFVAREVSLLNDTDKVLLNSLMQKPQFKFILTCDPSEFDKKSRQIFTYATRPPKAALVKKPKKAKATSEADTTANASTNADTDVNTFAETSGAAEQPDRIEAESAVGFNSASSAAEPNEVSSAGR